MTLVIYLLSRKFHPSYGLLPADLSGTDSVIRRRCSRGWEWSVTTLSSAELVADLYRWPSIFWQFFWSWLYAPYILWKSRDIEDTHGWRVQTILCCVAGLPASPLWLCALYVPQFAPLDAVFIAPQWYVNQPLVHVLPLTVHQVLRLHLLRPSFRYLHTMLPSLQATQPATRNSPSNCCLGKQEWDGRLGFARFRIDQSTRLTGHIIQNNEYQRERTDSSQTGQQAHERRKHQLP